MGQNSPFSCGWHPILKNYLHCLLLVGICVGLASVEARYNRLKWGLETGGKNILHGLREAINCEKKKIFCEITS